MTSVKIDLVMKVQDNSVSHSDHLKSNDEKFESVKTVLVVLSSKAMTIDVPGLRNLITYTYAEAAVFFMTTSGHSFGTEAPQKVDLVIDFTPPGARQSWTFAYRMRSRARYCVGRNAGLFYRKSKFDRTFDDAEALNLGQMPKEYLASESYAQKNVLELAGIKIVREGGVVPDRSHEIALELKG